MSCCQARGGTARAALRSERCSSGDTPSASSDAATWDAAGSNVKAAGSPPTLSHHAFLKVPPHQPEMQEKGIICLESLKGFNAKALSKVCAAASQGQVTMPRMNAEPAFILGIVYGLQEFLAWLQ